MASESDDRCCLYLDSVLNFRPGHTILHATLCRVVSNSAVTLCNIAFTIYGVCYKVMRTITQKSEKTAVLNRKVAAAVVFPILNDK